LVGRCDERGGHDVEVAAHERVQRAGERVAARLVDPLRPRREARDRAGVERAAGDPHGVRDEVDVAEDDLVAGDDRRARGVEVLAGHPDRGRRGAGGAGRGAERDDGKERGAALHGRTL
jgi:hypothetical protein